LASTRVPDIRIVRCNLAEADGGGDYVLYWMTAFARTGWNFSLQRAVEWARELGKPLVILHALYIGDRWAGDRLHGFAIDGMRDIAGVLADGVVRYYPYVEARVGAGRGLLGETAKRACVVVTDDFPSADLDRLVSAEAEGIPVLLEKVDSNGVLPLRAAERVFLTAASFRAFLHKNLSRHVGEFPQSNPLRSLESRRSSGSTESSKGSRSAKKRRESWKDGASASMSAAVLKRWPPASSALLEGKPREIKKLGIDHSVRPGGLRGGMKAAESALKSFVKDRLDSYAELRNHPDEDATSGLSPYLHFGHISTHQVLAMAAKHLHLAPTDLTKGLGGKGKAVKGKGWWRREGSVQEFTDQILTWRELGFNMAWQRPEYDTYESLPEWARRSLKVHGRDRRGYLYSPDDLEAAGTHDDLWNAAQNQLRTEGRLHNYLRMLWGKKILEWTGSPREALEVMIELNNKYALDGRNPNSYSGIFWILGRYDRPWGPKRPIFGTIRYMSSDSAMRKLRVRKYMEKYAPRGGG
jgi:deoxyribodipyrimidine photo-lyase